MSGTNYATEWPCPNGTFNNRTNIETLDECQSCSPGMFCDEEGLSVPAGDCSDGFYCGRGSNTPTPDESELSLVYQGETCTDQSSNGVNGVCPRGHYCPEGSPSPTQCPPGTQQAALGQYNLSQCEPCTSGFQCPSSATINATLPCDPGYYCEAGTVTSHLLCTLGHYCTGGNAVPTPCASGTYANITGMPSCATCPAG